MMEFKTVLYTTQRENWFKSDLDDIKYVMSQARGIEVKDVIVEYIDIDKPVTYTDRDGDVRIDWDWFKKTFTRNINSIGASAVAFHCTEYERNKWGLSRDIGGSYQRDQDHTIEFWFAANKGDRANRYNQTEFWRRFLHEMSHGFERFLYGERVNFTHYYDYELHRIQDVYKLYDWTSWAEKKAEYDSLLKKLQALMFPPSDLVVPLREKFWSNVTQPYGVHNAAYPITKTHMGTDFGTPIGTPIWTPAKGAVVHSGYMHSALGNWCIYQFEHDGGQYEMRLAHLFFAPLKGIHGRDVPFAYTGNTGQSTGPHVHLEVWPNEVNMGKIKTRDDVFRYTVDPVKFFTR